MKRIVAILMLCIGGLVVILMIPGWLDRIRLNPEARSRPAKSFRRDLAEDVRIGHHGVYGVDFVRCGKCSLEKMRRFRKTAWQKTKRVLAGVQKWKGWGEQKCVKSPNPSTFRRSTFFCQ